MGMDLSDLNMLLSTTCGELEKQEKRLGYQPRGRRFRPEEYHVAAGGRELGRAARIAVDYTDQRAADAQVREAIAATATSRSPFRDSLSALEARCGALERELLETMRMRADTRLTWVSCGESPREQALHRLLEGRQRPGLWGRLKAWLALRFRARLAHRQPSKPEPHPRAPQWVEDYMDEVLNLPCASRPPPASLES